MPVTITTKVKGKIAEGYDQFAVFQYALIKEAPGFILHSAYQGEEEMMVLEVCNSNDNADQFFSQHVAPNLPKDIIPKRSYQSLQFIVTPAGSTVIS
jgi:hypothetical protein